MFAYLPTAFPFLSAVRAHEAYHRASLYAPTGPGRFLSMTVISGVRVLYDDRSLKQDDRVSRLFYGQCGQVLRIQSVASSK